MAHFKCNGRETQIQDRSYDEMLISWIKRADHEPVIEPADGCLWVYIDLRPAEVCQILCTGSLLRCL